MAELGRTYYTQQKVPTMLGLILKDSQTQGDMLLPGDLASQKPGWGI